MTLSATVYGGSIQLDDDGLVLEWRGVASSREERRSSPRRIAFGDIRSIQGHEPGKLSNGWVRFGPDPLNKVGSQPPKDLYSLVFIRTDEGYPTLLAIVSEVCGDLRLANPFPEPISLPEPTGTGDELFVDPNGRWAGFRPDIAAAASRMKWTLGGKREIKNLERHLLEREQVEELAQGTFTQNQGIVVLTNQRLLFLFHGFVNKRTEEFSLEAITAVEISKSLNIGTLRLRMAGNSCEITAVIAQDLDRMANAIRNRIKRRTDQAAPSPSVSDDPVTLIKRLSELRDAGVLSDTEYEAKKQELLRRL